MIGQKIGKPHSLFELRKTLAFCSRLFVSYCAGFRTWRDVRVESVMRFKADIRLAERRSICPPPDPSNNAPPHRRCLAAPAISQSKGRSKYVERPTGLKIDYLKTHPASVLTDCTQRALGANQKCGSQRRSPPSGRARRMRLRGGREGVTDPAAGV
jgi:hypothetical protein